MEELEKKIIELENFLKEELNMKISISNVKEFKDLINQTIENLEKIKKFRFEVRHKI